MKRNLNRLMGLLLTIALAIGLMAGMSITALADNTGAYNSYLVESNDTEDAHLSAHLCGNNRRIPAKCF